MKTNYQFKDITLLKLALSHPSAFKQNGTANYERLEFLGDRVINLIIADYLYNNFPLSPEGRLALVHSKMVSRPTLAQIARSMELGEQIDMNIGESANGGRDNAKNLEDALEALAGAIFLDGGFGEAQKFVLHHWREYLTEDHTALISKDPKSELQEWAQKNGKPIPSYKFIERTGPDHEPTFTIEVSVEDLPPVQEQGNSKKEAEIKAATQMLKKVQQNQ